MLIRGFVVLLDRGVSELTIGPTPQSMPVETVQNAHSQI
jgi:hypothetical protein